jgi:hypothetical protein
MKAHSFAGLLDLFVPETRSEVDGVSRLSYCLRMLPATATMAASVAKIDAASFADSTIMAGTPTFAEAIPTLRKVSAVATILSTKATIAECQAMLKLASEHSSASIAGVFESIIPKPKIKPVSARTSKPRGPKLESVEAHAAKLMHLQPGTEAFGNALAELKADSTMKAAEMRLLASRLSENVSADATRAAVLKVIERKHKTIAETLAKANIIREGGAA